MRYLLIAAAVLAMNTLSATASNVSSSGNDTNIGKRFYSHSLYSLHRLDVGDMRTFNETEKLGDLQLVEGLTPHIVLNSGQGTLNELTLESAKKLLGEPSFIYDSPKNSHNQLVTFNLKTLLDRNEPNIFHVDIEIAKGGKAQNYRVRGTNIPSDTPWQTLAAE